jgi:P27 family predicted phage terminase small subunit
MPGGRPPKPTALKELQGNPGKRRLNRDEPHFGVEGLTCPRWLNAEARREWRRAARLLREQRVVTAADRGALAAYCLSYARWQQAEAALEPREICETIRDEAGNEVERRYMTGGLTQEVTICNKKGEVVGTKVIARPEVLIAQQYQRLMMAAAGKLGMDPSSRSKVSRVKEQEQNPILELLRGGRGDGRAVEG